MHANDVIDIDDALVTYIHERQHLVTHQDFRNNVNKVLSRAESLEELQNAVVAMSGNPDYRNLHRANLADEFISFAMALSYTNANFADELRKAGVNEQLIEYVDEYSRSQWQKPDFSKSRRRGRTYSSVRMDERRDSSQNVRNSGERSAEVVQQGLGSIQSSQRGTGGRKLFKSRIGTVRGWAMEGVIYLTKDGLNPETPILWNNVKSLMKRLPQWQQVLNDPNYQDIAGNEDSVASEVLARYSGKRCA